MRLGLLLALAPVQLVLGAVQQWEQMQEQMQKQTEQMLGAFGIKR